MPDRFKLGIITDEVSQDFDVALELADRFNLEAVELRSVYGRPLHKLEQGELLEIKEKAEKAGKKICALSAPIFKCELNDAEAKEHIELLKKYIEIAKLLGTGIVRGFSFWARKPFAEAKEKILKWYEAADQVLEGTGVCLAIEYDPSVYACTAAKVAALLESRPFRNLYALYDPGNNIWAPEYEEPYPTAYELLKGKFCHVHLKDAVKKDGEVEAVGIGLGEVGFGAILKRLHEDGYQGYLVVETHYRFKEKLSEEQLMRPGGEDFSEGGYAASEHCLTHLMELIKSP